jgi:DNA repair protein RadC
MAKQVAGLIREYRETLTLDHLISVPGMGLAKGAQILSAFELARRHLLKETVKIECAKDILPLVADIASKPQEHLSEAARILGLRILDNMIVARKGYFSFQEAGLIP